MSFVGRGKRELGFPPTFYRREVGMYMGGGIISTRYDR